MIELAGFVIAIDLLLYLVCSRRQIAWLEAACSAGMALTSVLLLVTLVMRGVIARHWPLGSQYEFTLGFAFLVVVIYLIVERRAQARTGGAGVCVVLLGLLGRALSMSPQLRAIGPLPPVLKSAWLQAHVLTVMVGYGCFCVAAGISLTSLGTSDAALSMRADMRRLVEIGFPWLTLGILTGAMWAHNAWGRYWGWDPKETWSLITWLWYLALLHVGRPSDKHSRQFNWLVLAGFGLVLFTFVGVPWLARWLSLDTLHGY